MTPLISIIVPVYNCVTFLPTCLKSIAGQTFTNWECLLVDDGSTDHLEEVVRPWLEEAKATESTTK